MKSLVVRRTAGPGGINHYHVGRRGTSQNHPNVRRRTVLKEDQWSSERLVMDSLLTPELDGTMPERRRPKTAAETARKVRGHYTTYYALEKPRCRHCRHGRLLRPPPGKRLNKVGKLRSSEWDIRERVVARGKTKPAARVIQITGHQVQRAKTETGSATEK